MELVDQQVINDNKEIYAKIHRELLKAKSEILIATAWFTDESLFDILSTKLDLGVAVEIIIADNQDNERLDFDRIVAQGGAVYKIKSSGYGNMNQKFCVIDKQIALHGSYNWTLNAKKNNHESIISTNHSETIQVLVKNFNNLKTNTLEPKNEPDSNSIVRNDIPADHSPKAETEFAKVLDTMIAAEIGSFDRKLLRQQGFERCSANNGDHQVLYKAFDTLYSVFINDIDVIDDKKKRLISKIEEYKAKSQDGLEKKCELEIDALERESTITKTNLEIKQAKLDAEVATATKSIDTIKETRIPLSEKENEELGIQIKIAEQECVIPKFKWFEFIPIVIFNIALAIYLFIFYSSAAYILLFSEEDAKAQEIQGISGTSAQIFNPEALKHAFEKTGTAVFFIFLFVFIPLALAIVDRFVAIKWKNTASALSILFGILILDGAIAYKVTQAVYGVNFLRGNVTDLWAPRMAFSDTNFYLVFVFGAFGLLLFKLTFRKMMSIFEERSPDTITQQIQLKIKHLREQVAINTDKIIVLKENVSSLEISIIQLKVNISQTDLELRELPIRLSQELQRKRTELLKDVENIDKIATIYAVHIESDNLPISVDALKDRINVFLEGWNDFLHKEYAIAKATQKTAQATEVATVWQTEKLYSNNIDNRVKIIQNAQGIFN